MLTIRPTNEVWEGALQESSVYRQPKLNTVPKAKYKNWCSKEFFQPQTRPKERAEVELLPVAPAIAYTFVARCLLSRDYELVLLFFVINILSNNEQKPHNYLYISNLHLT